MQSSLITMRRVALPITVTQSDFQDLMGSACSKLSRNYSPHAYTLSSSALPPAAARRQEDTPTPKCMYRKCRSLRWKGYKQTRSYTWTQRCHCKPRPASIRTCCKMQVTHWWKYGSDVWRYQCMHSCMCTEKHTHTHSFSARYTLTDENIFPMNGCAYACIRAEDYAHTRWHACTRAHTHTHTRTHTHTKSKTNVFV